MLLADALDETLVEHCRSGGRVVLAAPEAVLRPFRSKLGVGGAYFFLPPANYPPLEDGHGGTMIQDHPMLEALPHEGFADLQLYRLIAPAPPIDLEALGLGKVDPVVRVLSTYFVGLPLAYLVEASLGKGGLILCALNLDQRLPEARYLLAAMLRYAASRSVPSQGAACRLPGSGACSPPVDRRERDRERWRRTPVRDTPAAGCAKPTGSLTVSASAPGMRSSLTETPLRPSSPRTSCRPRCRS